MRNHTYISVANFDGAVIPNDDSSFDAVMFVDILHHTEDPLILLREAVRVARQALVIKDHTLHGFMARLTLRTMDYISNARNGVAQPYNYWPQERWIEAFDTLGLKTSAWNNNLGLYPRWASWIFERSLHSSLGWICVR